MLTFELDHAFKKLYRPLRVVLPNAFSFIEIIFNFDLVIWLAIASIVFVFRGPLLIIITTV